MTFVRKSHERGYADHGWLQSFHSFSFADFVDPQHMGFGNLRVINEDTIAAGTGFGMHAHQDMEIVTYLLAGELTHQDSMMSPTQAVEPQRGLIGPGDVQRMSAGRGIRHSEFNHSAVATHLLQIWIKPQQRGLEPSYEQKHFTPQSKQGTLCLIASPAGGPHALTIHADASIYAGIFQGTQAASLVLAPGRMAYVHLVRGRLVVNGCTLDTGDALALTSETELLLSHGDHDVEAEVLVFDLASHPASS